MDEIIGAGAGSDPVPPAPPVPPSVPGYDVEALIGAGAHGTVWRARDRGTGAAVAVKVGRALPDGGADAESAALLVRETALLRRITHPHVIGLRRVVDLADGRRAMVTDLAEGGSVAGLVAGRGRLEAGEVVTLLVPIARTLGELHERGLVHGDVSPGNVLLTASGRPVLADLGVARILGATAAASRWGRPGYVAPEVVAGAAPGPAADVHALAAVGWFALTGAPPVPGGLGGGGGSETESLRRLLLDCLQPDPQARPIPAALARRAWDAVAAAPVRLQGSLPAQGQVVSQGPGAGRADPPVDDVTRRIRASAAAAVHAAPQPRRRRYPPMPATRLVVSGTLTAVAVLLVVAALVGGLPGVPDRADARPVGTAAPSATGGPASALAVLAEVRARALGSHDQALLETVVEPGSPAEAADLALLERLAGRRVRLEGLSFLVDQPRLLRYDAEVAVVEARITTSAHERVSLDGQTLPEEVPAGSPETVNVLLVPASGAPGWQVREVRRG